MEARTTVTDHHGLLRLFEHLEGRRFIGVVDGSDCVELVFDDPKGTGWNLITVYTNHWSRGAVCLGGVVRPVAYHGGVWP